MNIEIIIQTLAAHLIWIDVNICILTAKTYV